MTVNFEFLGDEPIENAITCMKYKIDKVIFSDITILLKKNVQERNDF